MSRENVEKLRPYMDPFNAEALSRGIVDIPFLDPDVTYEDAILPDHVGEVYRGRDGIGRAGQAWLAPFEQHSIELEKLIDAGDDVVAVLQFRMRARHTGIEFEGPVAWLITFRDGLITRWRAYRSGDEALEAVGLSE